MKITFILSSMLLLCLLSGCSGSDNGTAPVKKPDTPTGLEVSSTGLTSLTLSWDSADRATGYKLYRSTSEDGVYSEVYSGEARDFLDSPLDYAARYYYKVTARNSGGESSRSDAITGTTDTPAGFTVTGSPGGGVDYSFQHNGEFNGHWRYDSDPVGLQIIVPSSGPQAGHYCFYDQIEGLNLYYHPTISEYPLPTGWLAVVGGTATSILLTPF
jgi:hypothetical protein